MYIEVLEHIKKKPENEKDVHVAQTMPDVSFGPVFVPAVSHLPFHRVVC